MSSQAQRIKELLGNGLSNDVVATAVGVHPSYVSQLMSDQAFANEVVELRTKTLTAATTRDRSWDTIEQKLLEKLDSIVENGMFFKPRDVLSALAVVNRAVRRGATAPEAMVTHQTIVNLSLPTTVVTQYRKNITGEVVEVIRDDGEAQTLVTMPAIALMQKLAKEHKGKHGYQQIRNMLPAGSEEQDSKG